MKKYALIGMMFAGFLNVIGCLSEPVSGDRSEAASDDNVGIATSASSNPFCSFECLIECIDACSGLRQVEDRLRCRTECTQDCERSFCPV